MLKKVFLLLLTCTMLLSLAACDGADSTKKGYAKGENFSMGEYTYALEKVIHLPEYDSSTQTGYGIVFLSKTNEAPISINMSTGKTVSVVNMRLEDEGNNIACKNVSFVASDEKQGYKANVTFAFQLEKGKSFPAKGVFLYEGSKKVNPVSIDLSGIEIPKDDQSTVEIAK